MGNNLKRAILKKQYEQFCESWRAEKLYQSLVDELPEGTFRLGKKPTFNMWLKAVKNKAQAQPEQKDEKKVEVTDTSWE